MTKPTLASLVAAIAFISMPAVTLAQGLVGGPPPRFDEQGKVVENKAGEDRSGVGKLKTGDREDSAAGSKGGGAVSKSPLRKPLSKPFELVPPAPPGNLDAPPPAVQELPPPRPGLQLYDWLFWLCMVVAFLGGSILTRVAALVIDRRSSRSGAVNDVVFVSRRLFHQITTYADMRLLLRLAEVYRGGDSLVGEQAEQFRKQMREAKDAMRTRSPNLDRVEKRLAAAKTTLSAILRSDPKSGELTRLFE